MSHPARLTRHVSEVAFRLHRSAFDVERHLTGLLTAMRTFRKRGARIKAVGWEGRQLVIHWADRHWTDRAPTLATEHA